MPNYYRDKYNGFIDNAEDDALLRDKKDEFAKAIARGVTDYQCL